MSKVNSTISTKMARLDELLERFEGDDFEIEMAIATFKEATTLAQEIETDLMEMKNTIQVIGERFDVGKE